MLPQDDPTHATTTRRPRLSLLAALALLAAACAPAAADSSGSAAGLQPPPAIAGPAPAAAVAQPAFAAGPADDWPSEQAAPTDQASAPPFADQHAEPPASGSAPASEAPGAPPPAADQAAPAPPASAMLDPCTQPPPPPLGSGGGPDRWQSFRAPLPPTPLWNPPGPKRVGLQAGHWLVDQVPEELRSLGGGAVGGGKQEWEVNLDLARRTQAILQDSGVEADVLPATVPPRYRAHVFIAIHADGDPAGQARGFKVARPGFSSVPEADDRLVAALNAAYEPATGLPRDDEHISLRMRYYYAFNSRRYCHAVAPGVPQAIVETGFLTSAADRALLLGSPDAAARGIADGVLAFLNEEPGGGDRP